jgi:hypothetical protein
VQDEAGENVPVLFVDKVTVPLGGSVPGATSDTVTVHWVGTPIVIEEPHATLVVVVIGLTVNASQLLVTPLLLLSPEYVALKL